MIAAILAFTVIATLLLVTLLILISISEDKEGTIASNAKHWLNTLDAVFPMIVILSVATASIAGTLFLNLYKPGKEGRDDYLSNIAVELGGIAYELFIVGLAFAWYERRKERKDATKARKEQLEKEVKREIRVERNQIQSYIPLKTDQGKIVMWQSIKRLNDLGVKDINLTHADLSVIEASKEDNVIRTILLENTSFSDASFAGVNLSRSEFINCRASGFSFTNAPVIHTNRSMFMLNAKFDGSSLQDGTFAGAYLNGASFKNVTFSREINFEGADLRNVSFDGAVGTRMNFNRCWVSDDLLSKIDSWDLDRNTFFKNHVLIMWEELISTPQFGPYKNTREVWHLANMTCFAGTTDMISKTGATTIVLLETYENEEE